jgi:hypothetical protein
MNKGRGLGQKYGLFMLVYYGYMRKTGQEIPWILSWDGLI